MHLSTRCKMGWTDTINAQVCAIKSHRNFSQRTHSIHPHWNQTHVLEHFVVFRCIWQCFVTTRNSVQNGMNWCNWGTNLCHEVVSKFFETNTHDRPHWTLKSCIDSFCSIWEHFEFFRYCIKLGAKRAELMLLTQNFMPRTRFEFFGNERTRSTPLDPKLMFLCIL